MERIVEPEMLDSLPGDDPGARRSRRDLRLLNLLMGNERRIIREVNRRARAARGGVVEVGAGQGCLAARLASRYPVLAVDLAGRPDALPERVEWRSGDLFGCIDELRGGVLVANLFLHHFDADELAEIGRAATRFDLLVICEPWRSKLAHALGVVMHPWINRITRHDMHVSIKAGFRRGELPGLLRLDGDLWRCRESIDLRGALHMVAEKSA